MSGGLTNATIIDYLRADVRRAVERDEAHVTVVTAEAALALAEVNRLTAERDEARQDADCAREWEQIAKGAADAALVERDAARAEAARLREALEACSSLLNGIGGWQRHALDLTRAALTPPTDQGEGA